MSGFDWKGLLGGIAPTIATAIGGPFAGTAVKFLAGELLGDENATEEELALAIQGATPEQLAQIKKVDYDFKTKMRELGIREKELAYQDTASAREMATKTTLVPQIVLSALFIGGYFILVFILFSGQITIDDSIRDMSNILIGVLTGSFPSIMQFWFGSSHGSKTKVKEKSK